MLEWSCHPDLKEGWYVITVVRDRVRYCQMFPPMDEGINTVAYCIEHMQERINAD